MRSENPAIRKLECREALAAVLYCIALVAYLFLHPEGEIAHWFTLVLVPGAGVVLWRQCSGGRREMREIFTSFGLCRKPKPLGLAAALVVGAGISALQLAGKNGPVIVVCFSSGRALWLWPLSLLLMIGTAATTEEFFFRGLLQTRLAAVVPFNGFAVLLTAAMFGAYHVPYAFTQASWGTAGNLSEAVLNGFSTGLPIGILLGLVFKIAGSNLYVSILAHALVNSLPAMLLVQKLFEKSGSPEFKIFGG